MVKHLGLQLSKYFFLKSKNQLTFYFVVIEFEAADAREVGEENVAKMFFVVEQLEAPTDNDKL
jgi:hypothetical protein